MLPEVARRKLLWVAHESCSELLVKVGLGRSSASGLDSLLPLLEQGLSLIGWPRKPKARKVPKCSGGNHDQNRRRLLATELWHAHGSRGHVAIAVEMRQEGFAGFKPIVCRLTIVELHRMEREAVALHEWLAIIGNPANGPLASGNPATLDDAAEWAAARLADIRRTTR